MLQQCPVLRVAPRLGHLDRLNRIYGYLNKPYPNGTIRFRFKIPNHENFATSTQYDWSLSINGNAQGYLPADMPTPRGKLLQRYQPLS